MPGMKATGTNTDNSTRVIAMMGAVISDIAFFVASAGENSGCSSMTRSTFSTTTMASSTTMPMASTTRKQRDGISRVTDGLEYDEGTDKADGNS